MYIYLLLQTRMYITIYTYVSLLWELFHFTPAGGRSAFKASLDNILNRGKKKILPWLRKCKHFDSVFERSKTTSKKWIVQLTGRHIFRG